MKKKFSIVEVVLMVVLVVIITHAITAKITKRSMQTKYLKAALVTPSLPWLELHGPSLESWQVYNENVIINTLKETEQSKGRSNDL